MSAKKEVTSSPVFSFPEDVSVGTCRAGGMQWSVTERACLSGRTGVRGEVGMLNGIARGGGGGATEIQQGSFDEALAQSLRVVIEERKTGTSLRMIVGIDAYALTGRCPEPQHALLGMG